MFSAILNRRPSKLTQIMCHTYTLALEAKLVGSVRDGFPQLATRANVLWHEGILLHTLCPVWPAFAAGRGGLDEGRRGGPRASSERMGGQLCPPRAARAARLRPRQETRSETAAAIKPEEQPCAPYTPEAFLSAAYRRVHLMSTRSSLMSSEGPCFDSRCASWTHF